MRSPVAESGRSRNQGVDGLVGEKGRVAGGLGELLNASDDFDCVADHRSGGDLDNTLGEIVKTMWIDGIRASSATTGQILDP